MKGFQAKLRSKTTWVKQVPGMACEQGCYGLPKVVEGFVFKRSLDAIGSVYGLRRSILPQCSKWPKVGHVYFRPSSLKKPSSIATL